MSLENLTEQTDPRPYSWASYWKLPSWGVGEFGEGASELISKSRAAPTIIRMLDGAWVSFCLLRLRRICLA